MTGLTAMRVAALVVVAALAGSLALADTPTEKLSGLAQKIMYKRFMAEQRSTHWGINMTTVSKEGGKREKEA